VPSSFRDHHQAQEGWRSGYGAAGWPSKDTHWSPTALLYAHPSPYALSHISREETPTALLVRLYGEGWQSADGKCTRARGKLSPPYTTRTTAASCLRRFRI